MVSSTILIGVHFSVHSRLPKCREPHQLRKEQGRRSRWRDLKMKKRILIFTWVGDGGD